MLGGEVVAATRGAHLPDPPPAPFDAAAGPAATSALPAGTAVSPMARVVWMGDSTAAGVGASGPTTTLPEQVARLLGQPIRLTVLARSGARVADVLHHQVPRLAALAPDAVFISVGANDAIHLTWRAHFRRDYAAVLKALPASVHEVVLLGVPDMGAPPRLAQPLRALTGWRGRALDADVRHLAIRRHALYVDIAGTAGPPFRRDPHRYFAADHYHPNDAGYTIWAGATAAVVQATPTTRP